MKPLKTKINELSKLSKELEESLTMNRNELIQTKQVGILVKIKSNYKDNFFNYFV